MNQRMFFNLPSTTSLCLLLAMWGGGAGLGAVTEAGMLYKAEYLYDSRGMVTNLIESYGGGDNEHRSLEYDSLGRMTHEQLGTHDVRFYYDRMGNRLRQVHPYEERIFHYNARNELERQERSGLTYELSYDPNGSLTQKVQGVTNTRYTWDSRGRLTSVLTNASEIFRATYAGGLNRQKKQEGTASTTYRHDGATAIQEVDESGDVNELVRGDHGAAAVGGVLYSANKEGTNTYTYNGVGSTVVLSGNDGTARIVKYDAFGNVLEADEGVEEERLANTKERDASTGLYFHGARYYDADLGRYISQDPAKDGFNHYVYANNAPLNFVDPTGLKGDFVSQLSTDHSFDGPPNENFEVGLALGVTHLVKGLWDISWGLGSDLGGSIGYGLHKLGGGSDSSQTGASYLASWSNLKDRAHAMYQAVATTGGVLGYYYVDPEIPHFAESYERYWSVMNPLADLVTTYPDFAVGYAIPTLGGGALVRGSAIKTRYQHYNRNLWAGKGPTEIFNIIHSETAKYAGRSAELDAVLSGMQTGFIAHRIGGFPRVELGGFITARSLGFPKIDVGNTYAFPKKKFSMQFDDSGNLVVLVRPNLLGSKKEAAASIIDMAIRAHLVQASVTGGKAPSFTGIKGLVPKGEPWKHPMWHGIGDMTDVIAVGHTRRSFSYDFGNALGSASVPGERMFPFLSR